MDFRTIATILALSLAAMPAAAQTTGPTTGFAAPPPPPPPQPEPEPEPEPQPEPEAQAPREPAGPEEVRSVHNDWEVRCFGDSDDCFMFQLANNSDGRPAAEFNLVKLPEGQQAAAGVTLTLPLGVFLQEGVVVRVDEGRAQQYPYNFCVDNGCISRFGLNEGFVETMRAGNNLTLRVAAINVPQDQNPITLTISLSGFTAAWNALP
ncbi:invasion associated locus B family protein [Pontivivens ytuae]|uniref:Invasion associated locus B family protein n=1 Tax=Pontivivens ytuae TaxID=2789856 RepID=A0A7S9LTQ0_9RHOB|nr:invasion associated locus B family protein [Pontivivens ytuae]QPH54570.1 invasion associated locus B family protein [Pontivivens ytuae]